MSDYVAFSPIRFTAETVTLDSDEKGFELVVTDTDGMVHRINVQGVLRDLQRVGAEVDRYFIDGQREAMYEAARRAAEGASGG